MSKNNVNRYEIFKRPKELNGPNFIYGKSKKDFDAELGGLIAGKSLKVNDIVDKRRIYETAASVAAPINAMVYWVDPVMNCVLKTEGFTTKITATTAKLQGYKVKQGDLIEDEYHEAWISCGIYNSLKTAKEEATKLVAQYGIDNVKLVQVIDTKLNLNII